MIVYDQMAPGNSHQFFNYPGRIARNMVDNEGYNGGVKNFVRKGNGIDAGLREEKRRKGIFFAHAFEERQRKLYPGIACRSRRVVLGMLSLDRGTATDIQHMLAFDQPLNTEMRDGS